MKKLSRLVVTVCFALVVAALSGCSSEDNMLEIGTGEENGAIESLPFAQEETNDPAYPDGTAQADGTDTPIVNPSPVRAGKEILSEVTWMTDSLFFVEYTNNSEYTLLHGARYLLERLDGETWTEISLVPGVGFGEAAQFLFQNEKCTECVDLTWHEDLAPGKYRVLKTFDENRNDETTGRPADDRAVFESVAEFELPPDSIFVHVDGEISSEVTWISHSGLCIAYTNNSGFPLMRGAGYILEKWDGGVWTKHSVSPDRYRSSMIYESENKFDRIVDLTLFYELEPGRYRLLMAFNEYNGAPPWLPPESNRIFIVTTEFELPEQSHR